MKYPRLSAVVILLILYAFLRPGIAQASNLYPVDKTGLRSFDGGATVLLLSFDTVKSSSFMEDRVIAHFDISKLSGTMLSATLNIPINDLDPDPPDGTFAVYAFAGDGTVSVDEWKHGYNYHVFPGIQGSRQTLTLNIKGILQSAINSGTQYLSFNFRVRSNSDRYWLDKGNSVPETYISYYQASSSLANAAANGFIHSYVYIWDGYEHVPVHVTDEDARIEPWQGFWAAIPNKSHPDSTIDLLIPKNKLPPEDVPAFTFDKTMQYLFSPPVQPMNTDMNGSSLGEQLGRDQYTGRWTISRWRWDRGDYTMYEGPDPSYDELLSLRTGKGFWLRHLNSQPVTVELDGEKADPPGGYFPITLSKNDLDVSYTLHMIGNPYWYPFKLHDCMVYLPMSDSIPAGDNGQTAEEIDVWDMDITLVAGDGAIRDTCNRIGLVENGNADQLRAIDIPPPGNYIRLALSDPAQPDSVRYAYDYRTSDGSEDTTYQWKIELTTTYSMLNAELSFEHLEHVPDTYVLTLTNDQTGDAVTLNGDYRIGVSLYSNVSKTYTLTAALRHIAVESDLRPEPFGIVGVIPNPFNLDVTISFSLDRPGGTKINVYNISGQRVATLLDDVIEEGRHAVSWNAAGQASGVYIVRMESHGRSDVSKMVLIK